MSEESLVQLFPFAMTVTGDGQRPLLLMKDSSHELTLAIPLNPIEAGITLTQSNKMAAPSSPHRVTELLLKSMGLKIKRCLFSEIRTGQLWVQLELENHPLNQQALFIRADESMSLCLHLEVPVFASREFILKSRVYSGEFRSQSREMVLNPKILEKPHPYVM